MSYLTTIKMLAIESIQNHNDGLQRYPLLRLLINHGPREEPVEQFSLYKTSDLTENSMRWVYRYYDFPADSEKFKTVEQYLDFLSDSKGKLTVLQSDDHLFKDDYDRLLKKWKTFSITPNENLNDVRSFGLQDKLTKLSFYNGAAKVEVSWVNDIPGNWRTLNNILPDLNALMDIARNKRQKIKLQV